MSTVKISSKVEESAWRDLKDLITKGLIRVSGKGKGSVYSLDPTAGESGD